MAKVSLSLHLNLILNLIRIENVSATLLSQFGAFYTGNLTSSTRLNYEADMNDQGFVAAMTGRGNEMWYLPPGAHSQNVNDQAITQTAEVSMWGYGLLDYILSDFPPWIALLLVPCKTIRRPEA